MIQQFFNASLVNALGVDGIFAGLAPVAQLGEVMDGFERGIASAVPEALPDFKEKADTLREMLEGSATPEAFAQAQREAAQILGRLQSESKIGRVMEATNWRGLFTGRGESGDLHHDVQKAISYAGVLGMKQVLSLAQFARVLGVSHPELPGNARMALPFVTEAMEGVGMTPQVILCNGASPLVVGESPGRSKKRMIVVAHYDIPVFEPEEGMDPRNVVVNDDALFGQGIVSKAGLIAILGALEAFRMAGKEFPLHIRLLVTGEGAIGEPHAPILIDEFMRSRDFDLVLELYGKKQTEEGPVVLAKEFRERRNGASEWHKVLLALEAAGFRRRDVMETTRDGFPFLEAMFESLGPYPAFAFNMATGESDVGGPTENADIRHLQSATRFLAALMGKMGEG